MTETVVKKVKGGGVNDRKLAQALAQRPSGCCSWSVETAETKGYQNLFGRRTLFLRFADEKKGRSMLHEKSPF